MALHWQQRHMVLHGSRWRPLVLARWWPEVAMHSWSWQRHQLVSQWLWPQQALEQELLQRELSWHPAVDLLCYQWLVAATELEQVLLYQAVVYYILELMWPVSVEHWASHLQLQIPCPTCCARSTR